MPQSASNELAEQILSHLFALKVFAWRCNTAGIYQPRLGSYRASRKTGVPDIQAVLPPTGIFLGIEIKTGKDRLRPEQIGFIKSVQFMGTNVLVVKDFSDFLTQFSPYARRTAST